MSDSLFPPAAPGRQRGATRAGALALAAATLAGSALAAHSVTSVGRGVSAASNCPAATARPGDWVPDDPDGCWERRGDGQHFRTTWGNRYYYHGAPPPTSRYHGGGGIGG
jgi:hypothetical protein